MRGSGDGSGDATRDAVPTRLEAIREAFPVWSGTTHWDGCETAHRECAIGYLLATIEQQRASLEGYDLLRQAINEYGDDGCIRGDCNSFGHADGCRSGDPALRIEQMQAALTAARAELRRCQEALDDSGISCIYDEFRDVADAIRQLAKRVVELETAESALDRTRVELARLRDVLRFPRNVLIYDGETSKKFKGEWVAVPREDFDAARAALSAPATETTTTDHDPEGER